MCERVGKSQWREPSSHRTSSHNNRSSRNLYARETRNTKHDKILFIKSESHRLHADSFGLCAERRSGSRFDTALKQRLRAPAMNDARDSRGASARTKFTRESPNVRNDLYLHLHFSVTSGPGAAGGWQRQGGERRAGYFLHRACQAGTRRYRDTARVLQLAVRNM